MPPKKRKTTVNSQGGRSVGLLGVPVYDSEEDEDWTPDIEPSPVAEQATTIANPGEAQGARGVRFAGERGLDVPLQLRRRKEHHHQGDRPEACVGKQGNAARPLRSARTQAQATAQLQQQKPQQLGPRGRNPSGRRTSPAPRLTDGGNAAAAVGAAAAVAEASRDWSGLTAPLLASVLRRACAASALQTAGAAPCVCRHWWQVCSDLQEEAKAAAAAAAGIDAAVAAAVAEAKAAAADAMRGEPCAGSTATITATATSAIPSAAAQGSSSATGGGAAAMPAAKGPARDGGTAIAGRGSGNDGDGSYGSTGGLWGCLDIRSRPSVCFNDRVIQGGLTTSRWTQVHILRLRNCPGLTPDGLMALAGGCPGLTSLELSQCDSLVKLDAMRVVLASLPRLRLLDLSHNIGGMLDNVMKMALAPRAPPPPPPPQQGQHHHHQRHQALQTGGEGFTAAAGSSAGLANATTAAAAADAGGGGSGGSGIAAWALPCPLRVLRARGCPRLGPRTFRALGPNPPYVMLPPSIGGTGASATAAAAVTSTAVPLFVHLTELDLTGSGNLASGGLLAIEKLQAAAPNLRILRLDATASAQYGGVRLAPEPDVPGPGFSRLRLCELGLCRTDQLSGRPPRHRDGSTPNMLRRVIGGSPRLHTLDVSGTLSSDDELTLTDIKRQAEVWLMELDIDTPFRTASANPYRNAAAAATAAEVAEADGGNLRDNAVADAIAAEATARSVVVHLGAGDRGGGGGTASHPGGPGLGSPQAVHLQCRLLYSLGPVLRQALVGPLRVLRASRSLLASDAGLHALAVRFGGTLQLMDVSESPNVTDAGLLHVARRCRALTSLDVSSTAITDFGVRVLLALRYSGAGVDCAKRSGSSTFATIGEVAAVTAATPPASGNRQGPNRAHVVDLTSDEDKEADEEEEEGRKREVGRLQQLDISSCRGVDRATRHAAAEGLNGLWRLLCCAQGFSQSAPEKGKA